MSVTTPEESLVRRAMDGDRHAFAMLCERHRTRVWRTVASVARGPQVEDLAQEAIVRAFCSLHTYRAASSFEAWLCRIALNAAHDYHKSAWKRRVVFWDRSPGEEMGETAVSDSLESEVARREVQRRVRSAVAKLPEAQRTPIWLHFFEEFTIAEIARLEGVSESTIRSRMHAGLKRLSFSLEDVSAHQFGMPSGAKADAERCGV